MGLRVNQKLEVDPELYAGRQQRRYPSRYARMAAYADDDN